MRTAVPLALFVLLLPTLAYADEPEVSIDRKVALARLLETLPVSSGACLVSFKTDVIAGQKALGTEQTAIAKTCYSLSEKTLDVIGNFDLSQDIFGKETFPKFGRVDKHLTNVQPRFDSPTYVRLSRLVPPVLLEKKMQEPQLYIALSSDKSKEDPLECTFIGPIRSDETKLVVECIEYMKKTPILDDADLQQLKLSPNPWLKDLASLKT